MVDPIASSTVKSTTEFFKEATKQLQNANEQVSKFEQLRTQMEQQNLNVSKPGGENFQIQQPGGNQAPGQVNPAGDVGKVGDIPKVTDMKSLEQVVNRLKAGQSRLNDLIKSATSGKTFSPQELLGLQAEVSQISTEIQLCSKVVEQGVSSLKSVFQMQV
jgi:hypothetical protein